LKTLYVVFILNFWLLPVFSQVTTFMEGEEAFLECSLSHDTAYVGEPVNLQVDIFTTKKYWSDEMQELNVDAKKVLVNPVNLKSQVHSRKYGEFKEVEKNGKKYFTKTISIQAFYALMEGEITIPPLTFDLKIKNDTSTIYSTFSLDVSISTRENLKFEAIPLPKEFPAQV